MNECLFVPERSITSQIYRLRSGEYLTLPIDKGNAARVACSIARKKFSMEVIQRTDRNAGVVRVYCLKG